MKVPTQPLYDTPSTVTEAPATEDPSASATSRPLTQVWVVMGRSQFQEEKCSVLNPMKTLPS